MAKAQTLDWKLFFKGEIKAKTFESPKNPWRDPLIKAGLALSIGTMVFHVLPLSALAAGVVSSKIMGGKAIAVMATDPSFASQLAPVTKPIKDIIFGFAHEIYFVMMAWGGMEALIGHEQRGFARMKSSTAAYVLLFWVPWIVRKVNSVVPAMGF